MFIDGIVFHQVLEWHHLVAEYESTTTVSGLETNILNYSRRLEIARHGFESVTLKLAEDYDRLKAICARHGIEISAPRVRKVVRRFAREREKTAAWRRILEQTTGALLRQSEEA